MLNTRNKNVRDEEYENITIELDGTIMIDGYITSILPDLQYIVKKVIDVMIEKNICSCRCVQGHMFHKRTPYFSVDVQITEGKFYPKINVKMGPFQSISLALKENWFKILDMSTVRDGRDVHKIKTVFLGPFWPREYLNQDGQWIFPENM